MALHCWKCGASLEAVPLPLSRYHPCPACGADLHVCRMCLHFDSRYRSACREPRAEPPREIDRANFCDWFSPNPGAYAGDDGSGDAARRELDDLFGASPVTEDEPAPNPLDELFRPKEKP